MLNPNNALRDDEKLLDGALWELDMLRRELDGQRMTHGKLLGVVKERGIHDRYYRYRKYEP